MGAALLAIFNSLALQLSGATTRAARQQKEAAAQQRWLALQLQRDAGLLIRQGALLAVDCSDKRQRLQGFLALQALWKQAGTIEPDESFPLQRQLELADGMLTLRVGVGALQRQREFSLQGLGACIDELG